jgi:hypothetical protein
VDPLDPQHSLTHPTEVEGCLVVDRLDGGAEAEESNQAGGAHKAAVVGPFAVVVVQAVRAHVHNNLKQGAVQQQYNTAGDHPQYQLWTSVGDLGCLSRIPDPDFIHSGSRIQKQQPKETGERKICRHTFFVATNITKLKNILSMKWRRKISGPISKEVWNLLPKKLSLNSQKYGFGIRDSEKTFSGSRSRGQKGTGSRNRIRNTAMD